MCFWDQAGFNYSDEIDAVYDATSWDFMLGGSYLRGLWTYTAGGVFLNKASTDNPVEWGQDNNALFLNLGIYRQVPELSVSGLFKVEVYGGIGRIMFNRQGPAPLSMPSNIAFGGVDPRDLQHGQVVGRPAAIAGAQPLSRRPPQLSRSRCCADPPQAGLATPELHAAAARGRADPGWIATLSTGRRS